MTGGTGGLRRAGESGPELLAVDFTDAARRSHAYSHYAEALAASHADDPGYVGVLLLGPRRLVDRLTGGLLLLR